MGRPAIAVRLLERGLGLDVGDAEHREEINGLLRAAWNALMPLLARPGEGSHYALDFETAHVAPVLRAYLRDARAILDCREPGCEGGCSACVLAGDLHAQAEILDRQAALAFAEVELAAVAGPSQEDAAAEGAVLARDVADEIAARVGGGAEEAILWPAAPFDPTSLIRPRLRTLLGRLNEAGHAVTLCLSEEILSGLDAAQRLGLRDAAIRHGLCLAIGTAPRFRNGARAVAALASGRIWASRDEAPARFGDSWGLGRDAPVVAFPGAPPACAPFDHDRLLPRPGARYIEPKTRLDGPSRSLGDRFAALVRPDLEAAGLWRPKQLVSVSYSDRYVRSPLVALLVVRAVSRLAAALAGPQRPRFRLATAPLKFHDGAAPYRLSHDWRVETDREQVLRHLCQGAGLDLDLQVGQASHSRRLTLGYADGGTASIVLDQGFGFLRPVAQAPHFDFREPAPAQAKRLSGVDLLCSSDGTTYIVVVSEGGRAT
ncbi:hypothetical protein [Methylobacterium indicum]|uniref:DUF1998 domain-containing protein n=1 Tax=Methylobacterium indicum TaxID=1775910 RepID=A0A8H9C7D4_9HYPH|nr:hypothetical protein [Methylobacterium indicum]BCM84245.1 hypothetical protein mvi_27060 [Methylobacterium indicum]